MSISGDITVTPGFTMLLIRGMVESKEADIVALELVPANDNAREMLVNLEELLSLPTSIDFDKDEDHGCDSPQDCLSFDWTDYNCGIAKSDQSSRFDESYVVAIPAGKGNIPDFLGGINGLSQSQSRPLLFLLLFTKRWGKGYLGALSYQGLQSTFLFH
jgi:hypothetical protein